MTLIAFVFPILRTPKRWLDKCLKSTVSEDPSTSNMVKVPKHCWILHHITFIRYFDHFLENRVGKRLSYWHEKSWDCLLARWLHCLVVNRDKLTIPIQMQLSRKQKIFLNFSLIFWNLNSILNILKKMMTLTAFVFLKVRTLKT